MNTPRIFHRIWLGAYTDDPIPDRFEAFWNRLKVLHPHWLFQTWASPLEPMQCQAVFDAARTHAGRSDVMRYEVLARYGGCYLDTDVEPLRPFDELLDDDRPFAGWEDANLICPTVMGGPPGHPALTALLDRLPAWAVARPKAPPNRQTGPHFLTEIWKDRTDVRLLDPLYFYPTHWSNKAGLEEPPPPESLARHHWSASWLPKGPPQRSRARP